MERSRARALARETRRCLRDGGEFRVERGGRLTLLRRAGFPAERLLEAVERHAHALRQGGPVVLKADHRARVTRIALPGHETALCVKEFVRGRAAQRLADRWRGSRARAAWLGAQACRVRDVPAPRALGVVEAAGRSYFVSEFVAGAVTLNDYVSDFPRPRDRETLARWRRFVCAVADFVRHLHAQDLRHRDLASKNILVRECGADWEIYLIDLSDVRPGRRPSLPFRIRNLGQLDQFQVNPSRTDRLRFLRRYGRDEPFWSRHDVWRRIDALGAARRARWLAQGGWRLLEERRRQGRPA